MRGWGAREGCECEGAGRGAGRGAREGAVRGVQSVRGAECEGCRV